MPPNHLPPAATILRSAAAPALLVTDLLNIRYLSGIPLSAGCILISSEGYRLFVDQRYREAARGLESPTFFVSDISDLDKKMGPLKKIALEADSMTLSAFHALQSRYKNKKFVHTSKLIQGLRRSKTPSEVLRIESACKISKKVLRDLPTFLRSGISEQALARCIHMECLRHGADGMAFDTIVAFGEHTARPHHRPTDRRLLKGDLIQIDMGAMVAGYASDYSRVYKFGMMNAEEKKVKRALEEAKKKAESMIRPSVTNHTLDRAARTVLKEHGYSKEFPHALGHGLGLEIHEGITLSSKAPRMALLRNEVITIEPGLYFEGRFGMRIEDTIVVR